jgi:hypothetical protein
MLAVHLALIIMLMAIDATEYQVIARVCMAVGAQRPCAGMMPGIDREILTVMVKGGRYPRSRCMARLAIGGELGRSVRRIVSLVVIIQVTANTRIRDVVIVPVMALVASGRDMCTGQWPVSIVNRECGRAPARVCCMAIPAGRWNVGSLMVRICSSIIICQVAANTGSRGAVIITVMTQIAIRDTGMSTC